LEFYTDVLFFRYAFFHTEVHSFLMLLPRSMREKLANICIDHLVLDEQWTEVEEDLASLLPGLKEICLAYRTGGKNIREQGVVGFKTFPDAVAPDLDGLTQLIPAVKKRNPEWKEPVVKFGEFILGLVNANSLVVVREWEDDMYE
jgi:hypothetical protein